MADFPKTSFYGEGQTDLRGPKGDQGEKGDQGDLGPRGPQGFQGIQGDPGTNGRDGINAVYRFGGFAVVGIQASEILLDHPIGQACTLGAQFFGCTASCGVPPEELWVASIAVNDAAIGTLTITPSGAASFASTGLDPVRLAQGDVVSLTAPEDPDLSIGRVRFTLIGEL
jgi:hypothetical protein